MIHNGPGINSQRMSQATLSAAQLLEYNSSVCRRAKSIGVHYNKARETSFLFMWDSQYMQECGNVT